MPASPQIKPRSAANSRRRGGDSVSPAVDWAIHAVLDMAFGLINRWQTAPLKQHRPAAGTIRDVGDDEVAEWLADEDEALRRDHRMQCRAAIGPRIDTGGGSAGGEDHRAGNECKNFHGISLS